MKNHTAMIWILPPVGLELGTSRSEVRHDNPSDTRFTTYNFIAQETLFVFLTEKYSYFSYLLMEIYVLSTHQKSPKRCVFLEK